VFRSFTLCPLLQFSVQAYPFGHFSVHDFYEVKSMRGVYITTTVNKGQ